MNEVLDNIDDLKVSSKSIYIQVLKVLAIAMLVMIGMEVLILFIPEEVYDLKIGPLSLLSIVYFSVFFYVSLSIPTILNKLEPALKELGVVVYTMLAYLGTQVVLKIVQKLIYLKDGIAVVDSNTLKSLMTTLIFGMLIANIKIHKLRNKSTAVPIMLVFLMVAVYSVLISYLEATELK